MDSEEGKGSTFSFIVGDYQETELSQELSAQRHEAAAGIEPGEADRQPQLQAPSNEAPIALSPRTGRVTTASSIKRLLLVDDDLHQRNSLMELIGGKNVIITAVSSAAEAREELKVGLFDCMVLDLGLSDISGFELLAQIKSQPNYENMAVFIYTGKDLTTKEEFHLKRYAHAIIIKDAHSPERLLDEIELYLNSNGEAGAFDMLNENEPLTDASALEGLNVLLVDDDVRNVFAISNVLELHGMQVTLAENGLEAIQIMEEMPDIDLVLMDIMMPEMDGYEAIAHIRGNPEFRNLPIIALTAKAMKEDRVKCIESGASDYIVKPIIPEQLISLVRVWVSPEEEG